MGSEDALSEFADDIEDLDYDIYSKTPPRTKILRKNRERKYFGIPAMSSPKLNKSRPLNRRNTVSSAYEDLIEKAEDGDSDHGAKRTSKRNLKLLRGSERDLKLDIASAQAAVSRKESNGGYEQPETPQPSYQIESSKRFKSLSIRTVPCSKFFKCKQQQLQQRVSKDEDHGGRLLDDSANECPQSRVDFHNTLSLLIRMGCGEKQQQEASRTPRRIVSREEQTWQNELKDLIWLELQAFHADRSPMEEDNYLCMARESVEPLLNDIMKYRFRRQPKQYSTSNSDSGVEDDCPGCLSMFCLSCMEAQNDALKEVERLMQRLEAVESLFPSSKAFAELYPLYHSPEFVGRVKAISLWYNMTKHQRIKLLILGKLLSVLENKSCQWPMVCNLKDSVDSTSSPSDSNSSSSSVNDYLSDSKCVINLYNVTPIALLVNQKTDNNVSPYRHYIEEVLKTRTLNKSLIFLEKLHFYVLRKAQLTLEKPEDESIFEKVCCETEEEELTRYGCWSPEAQALDLPSYKSSFLFLGTVPLQVIHEFLKMRVEQKPENPSPLSIRQLMRELKEGLKIAAVQKEKVLEYIDCTVRGTKHKIQGLRDHLDRFDKTLLRVFSDYLSYVEQWALLHHVSFQKNLLEEEWQFSCEIVDQIPEAAELLKSRFCFILSTILTSIGETLVDRIEQLSGMIDLNDEMLKQNLFFVCRELQSLFNEQREMSVKTLAFCKIVFKSSYSCSEAFLRMLGEAIVSFKCVIPKVIEKVQVLTNKVQCNFEMFDEIDRGAMVSRTREISMQAFKFGFEFYRELSNTSPSEHREKLVRSMVQFANLWMKFVTEKCERGRGMRPRWAYQGLEFLLTVCEPRNTKFLTDDEFEELKCNMDACISHVIGTTAPSTPDSGFYSGSPRTSLEHIRARSRGSSPSPRPTYKSQRSGSSRKTSMEQHSPQFEHPTNMCNDRSDTGPQCCLIRINLPPCTHSERWLEAIHHLDSDMEERLMKQNLIGKVITCKSSSKKHYLRRYVNFTWQRGIKIGQGRFGKVYTAVNNNTGEMMAVKEIAVQQNDVHSVKRIAEEVKILEGISHRNVVKYYGVEVHKEEMLIFMEFCAEGTLESLVMSSESGLPELLVRRYAYQLVSGVACLHEHGIVHRDIKTANVFLTDEGNCLKIGDFGCAVKIKSHTTMPGELKGFVGTQAYMAPEVFTQTMSGGHGRAADIWSVGCVVVEMASGKRPWHQFDSNYQIMFKVGMGQSPDPPDDMIDEGLEFLERCFKHNPKDRATAKELLDFNFVKVGEDL